MGQKCVWRLCSQGNIQYGVSDKEGQQAECEKSEASNIDYTSPSKNVAIALLLLVGVGVVQIVVLLDILGEQ